MSDGMESTHWYVVDSGGRSGRPAFGLIMEVGGSRHGDVDVVGEGGEKL